MPVLLQALAACAGLVLGAAPPGPQRVHWHARDAIRDLALPLERAGDGELGITAAPRPDRGTPPPCFGDVCQPIVDVPGIERGFGRAHRTELVLALLDRAEIEPLATITWALVATGLRFDYTPPALDANPGGHGWGSVFVRLRLRLDAGNVPTIPPRHPARSRTHA